MVKVLMDRHRAGKSLSHVKVIKISSIKLDVEVTYEGDTFKGIIGVE